MERTYTITSDRWASEEVDATFAEIQEQARMYDRDRQGMGSDYYAERGPVTVEEKTRYGQNVVIDDTGDVVAVEKL